MRYLIAFLLALLGTAALATDRTPAATARADSMSNSSMNGGDAWAVALPGFGAPSYAGQYSICVTGDIWLFGARTYWRPDMDCVREIARLTKMLATPVPKPSLYPTADMRRDDFNAMDADSERMQRYQRALDQVRAADCGNKARTHKSVSTRGCGK